MLNPLVALCVLVVGIAIGVSGCTGPRPGEVQRDPQKAQTAPVATKPEYQAGDTWSFRSSSSGRSWTETVTEVWADGIVTEIGGSGSTRIEARYTQELNPISIAGKPWPWDVLWGETQYLPYSAMVHFPLEVGKRWAHNYTAHGDKTKKRTADRTVEVYEDVTVPAGTFKAYRIESSNRWHSASTPAIEIYWYAPEARRIIKYESPKSPGFNQSWELTQVKLVTE